MAAAEACALIASSEALRADKARDGLDDGEDAGDATPPSTTASECSEPAGDEDWDAELPLEEQRAEEQGGAEEEQAETGAAEVPELGPGLFDEPADAAEAAPPPPPCAAASAAPAADFAGFTREETLFVFDWDDTILPSTWIKGQGLRLDSGAAIADWQRERLAQAAAAAAETLILAKRCGTVVLVTNAERGWIELSCQRFAPALLPIIENIRIVSARTTYESERCTAPLQWKAFAFHAEIARACGAAALADPARRKNVHSLGDSVHEREALLRATVGLPSCCWKALKFVDRPDISQILSQHALVSSSFEQIVQHGGNLDLTINC